MGCGKSSPKREVYSNTIVPQETRKYQIDNLTLQPKTGKRKTNKNTSPKVVEGKK